MRCNARLYQIVDTSEVLVRLLEALNPKLLIKALMMKLPAYMIAGVRIIPVCLLTSQIIRLPDGRLNLPLHRFVILRSVISRGEGLLQDGGD